MRNLSWAAIAAVGWMLLAVGIALQDYHDPPLFAVVCALCAIATALLALRDR